MQPEYVITSEHVWVGTDDAQADEALALAVAGGRVQAIAPRDQAEELAAGAPVEDWGDAFVCPGFHDAHMHVFHAALFPSELATEYAGESEEDCVAHLVEWTIGKRDDGS